MKLSNEDKRMLDGEYGEATRIGMAVMKDLGELYGAEEMVSISMVHDDSAWFEGLAAVEFAEHLLEIGGKFRVPTSLNAILLDMEKWQELGWSPELYEIHKRIARAHTGLGAAGSFTCTPYHAGFVPRFGEQVAWAESNATNYVNSVIGARTERYAGLLDLCAGLTGRVPYRGLHVPENRRARVLIKLEGMRSEWFEDDAIWDVLGYVHGEIVGDRIGAMEGLPTTAPIDGLKRFSATAASSGGVGLFHLIGLTPEAHTREMAFHNQKPEEIVTVDVNRIRESYERMSAGHPSEINMINTGCPHLSYAECVRLAKAFNGRKVNPNIEFWAYTCRANLRHIKDCGLYDELVRCGVRIFTDGCPMVTPWNYWKFKGLMSNSGKFCSYCYSYSGIYPVYGSLEDLVETAVNGKLTRKERPWMS